MYVITYPCWDYKLNYVRTRAVSDCLIRPFYLPASVNALLVNCAKAKNMTSQWSHSSETWTQYVVQPTQCTNQLSSWDGKTFRKKSRKLFRGTWFWWNSNLMCRWLGALLTLPFECFVHQRATNCPSMTKINMGQYTHYLSVCTKSESTI